MALLTENDVLLETLHRFLKPGDTVFTILQSTARSGMSRVIRPIVFLDNRPEQARDIGSIVAKLLGHRQVGDGVQMRGAGMDMGFALVYELAYKLFPDGFDCIGDGCPSNDHLNRVDAKHHDSGGYALKHRWL